MLLQSVPSAPTNLEAVITSTRYLPQPTNRPQHPSTGSSPLPGRVRQTPMGPLQAIQSSTSRKTQRGRGWSTQHEAPWRRSPCRVCYLAPCTVCVLSPTTSMVRASRVLLSISPPSPRWQCLDLLATLLLEPPRPSPSSYRGMHPVRRFSGTSSTTDG